MIDWSDEIRKAEEAMRKNTARIEAGETFKGHQQTSRKAPGKTDGKSVADSAGSSKRRLSKKKKR